MGKKKADKESNLGKALFKSRFSQSAALKDIGGSDRWVRLILRPIPYLKIK